MLNVKMLVLILAMSFSLLGLVTVKVYVQDLREEITVMENTKYKLSDEVQVLNAEWSNLNRPERIKTLAKQYLQLENVNTNKIENLHSSHNSEKPTFVAVKNGISSHAVKWRYKPRDMVMRRHR